MRQFLAKLGPGLMLAAAAVGVSHLVYATRAGADFGLSLIWLIVLISILKYPAFRFASNVYLDFFAERIEWPIAILLVAGAVAVMLAWSTVAGHAYRIARANPILALRYE